jgi:hypothetical protein
LPVAPGDAGDGVIEYPEIRRIHDASCLATGGEVAAWRAGASAPGPWRTRSKTLDLSEGKPQSYSPGPAAASPQTTRFPRAKGGAASTSLGQVVLGRVSTRRFSREPIPFSKLSTVLDGATKRLPSDFNRPDGEGLVETYVIANAVEGLPSGAYVFSPGDGDLELLKEGAFREEAGHLCFEQALGADASAVLFLMQTWSGCWRAWATAGTGQPSWRRGRWWATGTFAPTPWGWGPAGLLSTTTRSPPSSHPTQRGRASCSWWSWGSLTRRTKCVPSGLEWA